MTNAISNSSHGLFPEKNLAHVASVRGQLADFTHRFLSNAFTDCDDLGPFSAAKFVTAGGFEFWIYKYQETPSGTIDIFFESQLPDWEARLTDILSFLAISSDEVVWRNTGYLRTP